MSYGLVDAVFDLDLPLVPKAVLLSLARHAQRHSTRTWPSQETIAQESGCSLRSVRTGLTYLEKHKLAVPIAYPKGGRGKTTVYELALTPAPEGEESWQEVPGMNGAKPAADARFTPINVAKSAQNVARNVVNVAGAATESVMNRERIGKADRRGTIGSTSARENDRSESRLPDEQNPADWTAFYAWRKTKEGQQHLAAQYAARLPEPFQFAVFRAWTQNQEQRPQQQEEEAACPPAEPRPSAGARTSTAAASASPSSSRPQASPAPAAARTSRPA